MNVNSIVDILTDLDLVPALSLIGVLVAVICSLLALLIAVRKRPAPQRPAEEHFPVAGRIEKLERSLNEFRTDTLRSLELMRQELRQLASAVGVKPAQGAAESEAPQLPAGEAAPAAPGAAGGTAEEALAGAGIPAEGLLTAEAEKKK